jgi:hypothetical protein
MVALLKFGIEGSGTKEEVTAVGRIEPVFGVEGGGFGGRLGRVAR